MTLVTLRLQLPRAVVLAYACAALGLSLVLLATSSRRGLGELSLWAAAALAVGVLCVLRPHQGPLAAGFLAFVLGFVRTYRNGPNLDLGTSLILLSLAVFLVSRLRGGDRRGTEVDLAGLLLLCLSAWSALSLAFSVLRIRAFVGAPGFSYHVYRFNSFGLPSDAAITQAVVNASATFAWFGLYLYACAVRPKGRALLVPLFAVLAMNSAALLVQARLAPGFLHPVGWPFVGRGNGLTSFCWALGDATLAFFLLLPVWGSLRGRPAILTGASVVLLVHSAVASGSRTCLGTMAVVSVVWAGIRAARLWRAGRGRPALALVAGAALLLCAGTVAYELTPAGQSSALARLKDGITQQGLLGQLVATRLHSYPLAFRVLREYPLSGIGPGLYPLEIERHRALLMPGLTILDPFIETSYAPNQFLNTGVELGLPATAALLAVFALAAARAFTGRLPGPSRELGVGVLALAAALQLGPGLYNSEAVVFDWLLVGLAASSRDPDAGGPRLGPRASAALLAGVLAIAFAGQLVSRPALAIERQWQQLRWRLNMGMQPPQSDGRWTGAEATFSTDASARALRVRWHAGDQAARSYSAEVSFYVDGVLAERSLALPGRIRESVLPLPAARGFKRISVRVSPPFVPADALGGVDRRSLGIFLHAVVPVE